MATIVNTPAPSSEGNGSGFLIGVVLLIAFVLLLLFYGLPYLRSGIGGTQVNVPGKIDVNVQQPGK